MRFDLDKGNSWFDYDYVSCVLIWNNCIFIYYVEIIH